MPEPIFRIFTPAKPNELPFLRPWLRYAMVHEDICEAAKYLMTKLRPVPLQFLNPDERTCIICQDEYRGSEDPKLSHTPVKMECGHIFGRRCIIKWLDPLCYWGSTEGRDPEIRHMDPTTLEDAHVTCPACRHFFFFPSPREPLDAVAAQLWLWDIAYAYAGIARSDGEEHTRKFLWEYVEYCRSVNEFKISRDLGRKLTNRSEDVLRYFATQFGYQHLSEVQERLRLKLLKLENLNVGERILANVDDIDFADLFRRNDSPYKGDGNGIRIHFRDVHHAEEDEAEDGQVDGKEDSPDEEDGDAEDVPMDGDAEDVPMDGDAEGEEDQAEEGQVEEQEASQQHAAGSCSIL